jgi:circadian clock protein KaiB
MNTDDKTHWVFRLFVSRAGPNTEREVALLEEICEQHLEGVCDIEVINVIEYPRAAMDEDIIATPCLLKKYPKPERRIIGNLSDKEKLLSGLEI